MSESTSTSTNGLLREMRDLLRDNNRELKTLNNRMWFLVAGLLAALFGVKLLGI